MTSRRLISAALLYSLSLPALNAQAQAPAPAPAQPGAQKSIKLEEITVTGILRDPDRMTGSAHLIDQETLEKFNYDDINRVLNFVPGVYSREEDGVGLRPNIGMRGASAERSQKVTLMEDAVLIAPAPYSAPAAYFFPLTSRMVGVEVFKGPSSIQYGPQTIGGAINLISAPIPSETQALAEVVGGSDAYGQVHLRGGTQYEGLGVMGEYIHLESDGFKNLDGGGDTGFDKNEVLFKAAHDIGPGTLQLRVGYADEDSDETYLGLTEDDFRDDHLRRYRASALDHMSWNWKGGRATWSQPLLSGDLQVTGYLQQFNREWRKFNNFKDASIRDVIENPYSPFNQLFTNVLHGDNTDGVAGSPDDLRIGTNDRDFNAGGIQGRMRWNFDAVVNHSFEIGGRFHNDRIERLHDEYGYEQIDGQLVKNSQPRVFLANNTAETDALALWMHDEAVLGRWTFVPGVRVESIYSDFSDRLVHDSEDNDYVVVLPGLGTSVDIYDNFSLLAGVHKGFSPATPGLKKGDSGTDDDPEPEEAINYEFGGRWHGDRSKLEVIGFYNDYSNLTATCTISSGCSAANLDSQTNAGKVRTYGVESGWNTEFPLGTTSLWIPAAVTYTYTQAEFRESFTSPDPQFGKVEAGYELPYIPPHRANASIGLAGPLWSAQFTATYVARMRDQAGEGSFDDDEGSDEYTVLDFVAQYDLSRQWTVSGRIDNVLDEDYVVSRRPYGARPGKPFGFQVAVAYTY